MKTNPLRAWRFPTSKIGAGNHRYGLSMLISNFEAATTFLARVIDALIPQVLAPGSSGVHYRSG
jgi:hypothetical protein